MSSSELALAAMYSVEQQVRQPAMAAAWMGRMPALLAVIVKQALAFGILLVTQLWGLITAAR